MIGIHYSSVIWCPECAKLCKAHEEHLHPSTGWCCLMLDDRSLDACLLKLMVHSCSGIPVHRLASDIRDIFKFRNVRFLAIADYEYMYVRIDPRDRRKWRRAFDTNPRSCIEVGS